MKIYIAKILKRTEIKKDIPRKTRDGLAYTQHATYAFDTVEDVGYYTTRHKAREALRKFMMKTEELNSVEWYKKAATPELLWPENIYYWTDRKDIGDDRKILFMAILEEAEVA